jgi:glucokinase
MITLGTGVGGGIIIDRKIYSGFNHIGGELGHMVIEYDGVQCGCGRKGCWEAYSSATGLIRMTGEAMDEHPESKLWEICTRDNVSGRSAFQAEAMGDKTAAEVVRKYCEYLACGLTNIVNIFQPEVLCVGGAISKEGEYLLAPVRKFVERERYTRYCEQTELKIAALGNDAGIIGAAML